MNDSSILKISSNIPGPTVAVMAGVHGNERAGIIGLQEVLKHIQLERGTVYFIFANPPAMEKNVRMIGKNLNRCFLAENNGSSDEDVRARQLMKILYQCDALLDLHGYNGPEDTPFIITAERGLPVAAKLDFSAVITGFDDVGAGGTDSYMTSIDKIGLCAECGSNERPEEYAALAVQSIHRFLAHFDVIINTPIKSAKGKQRVYRAVKIVKRVSPDFRFLFPLNNFQALPAGKVFASDGLEHYIAEPGQYILFPRASNPIGAEAFTLIVSEDG